MSYRHRGTDRRAWAREVILCGGAIDTPQLLQRSGVRPAGHLRSLDIEPVADLPGAGATNHVEGGGFVCPNDEVGWPNLVFHFLPLAIRYDGSSAATPRRRCTPTAPPRWARWTTPSRSSTQTR